MAKIFHNLDPLNVLEKSLKSERALELSNMKFSNRKMIVTF